MSILSDRAKLGFNFLDRVAGETFQLANTGLDVPCIVDDESFAKENVEGGFIEDFDMVIYCKVEDFVPTADINSQSSWWDDSWNADVLNPHPQSGFNLTCRGRTFKCVRVSRSESIYSLFCRAVNSRQSV